jgi:hypothetical protein
MSVKKFTIYGERCSGTNYLENIISLNYELELTYEYGWKHFFGFDDLTNSDDTLFICIIRNPYNWFNSLYKHPHHLCDNLKNNINNFLNNEVISIKNNNEIMTDRNIYTQERYKNLFELRHTKLKYLIETLPTLVKNHTIIKYEGLLNNFETTMKLFDKFNLIKKYNKIINNNKKDFKYGGLYVKKNYYYIKKNLIYEHKDFNDEYEKLLGYL